ncbi:unnamed protein product [Tuber melanosporum]|uniref:(Perigord truffle) hypothetical protein n=1 Tax=Tuber melanosporum (strain Mel28) TaxID=656061 RepID=D5GKJ1_TUBMM|nr:unnamed protein product [Tuber melanosporum]
MHCHSYIISYWNLSW